MRKVKGWGENLNNLASDVDPNNLPHEQTPDLEEDSGIDISGGFFIAGGDDEGAEDDYNPAKGMRSEMLGGTSRYERAESDADLSWAGMEEGAPKKLSKKEARKAARDAKRKKREDRGNTFVDDDSNSPVVMSGNLPTDDFVILEEHGKVVRTGIAIMRYIIGCAIFFCLIMLVYVLLSYKFVPEDVRGTDINIFSLNVISRDYKLNPDEPKDGDIILAARSPSWCPLVYDYDLYTYHYRKGGLWFVSNSEGLNDRLEEADVSYILDGLPRVYTR